MWIASLFMHCRCHAKRTKVPDRDEISIPICLSIVTRISYATTPTTNNYPTIHTKLMFTFKCDTPFRGMRTNFGISPKNLKIADDYVEYSMNFSMEKIEFVVTNATNATFVDRHSVCHFAFKGTDKSVLRTSVPSSHNLHHKFKFHFNFLQKMEAKANQMENGNSAFYHLQYLLGTFSIGGGLATTSSEN